MLGGYKSIVIAPKPDGKLTRASAELETVHGTAKSVWMLENNLLKLDVSAPANTRVKFVRVDSSHDIGSGPYHFESSVK